MSCPRKAHDRRVARRRMWEETAPLIRAAGSATAEAQELDADLREVVGVRHQQRLDLER